MHKLIIDSGGTSIDYYLEDEVYNRELIATKAVNGNINTNINLSSIINQQITELISKYQFEKIICGIAGYLSFDKKEQFIEELGVNISINCYSDVELHHLDYFGSQTGLTINCGTGSAIVYSKNGYPRVYGGWGPIFGEIGSGYHIGLLALEKLIDYYETDIDNEYTSLMYKHLNISNPRQIIKEIYGPDSKNYIANLAKFLSEHSANEDVAELFANSARQLATWINSLEILDDEIQLNLVGSLFKNQIFYQTVLKELNSR